MSAHAAREVQIQKASARVKEAGGEALFERLLHLDQRLAQKPTPNPTRPVLGPDKAHKPDFDVIIAGGGLSLLLAPLLAQRGLKTAVLERSRAGGAHREWNASKAELSALTQSGLFSAPELEAILAARYKHGICRWHEGGSYAVKGVLDLCIDAGLLLQKARERAISSGVTLLDGHSLEAHTEGEGGVHLWIGQGEAAKLELSAKILVDARGASSPYATADLLCPTVGGVFGGIDEGDDRYAIQPDIGEILVTTEHVEEGRQHLWEAFPGRRGETTVYLFYYARAQAVGPGSLMQLYARFFETLPRYKRGKIKLLRPTFGYIPGWSRMCPGPKAPGKRVILVGDAAARHSPLTFCGFGCFIRTLSSTAENIARASEHPQGRLALEPACDAPIHTGTGALSMLMASVSPKKERASDMNRLLDAAFSVLYEMGDEAYGALMRDTMSARDFVTFLRKTAALRPEVYAEVFKSLPWGALGKWSLGLGQAYFRSGAA